MTHYMVITAMPHKNFEYMIDDLERVQTFPVDKQFCKDNKVCVCAGGDNPVAKANIREIKLLEIDVPTPAQKAFEKYWLSNWFKGISPNTMTLDEGNKFYTMPLRKRIFVKPFYKLFYWFMDKFLRHFFFARGLAETRKQKEKLCKLEHKQNPANKDLCDVETSGTIYKKFEPMSNFGKCNFNQRNYIIGRMVEHPIGSWDYSGTKCKTCGGYSCKD